MSLPNRHSDIQLQHGHLVERIKNCSQRDWITACERLGLFPRPDAGRGSHCAVYATPDWPPQDSAACVLTIARNLYPQIQRAMVKRLVAFGLESGAYAETDVWAALNVKMPRA